MAEIQRSKYLADALRDLQRTPQIQSGGELAARLMAEAINQHVARRAENEAQGRQDMKDHQRQAQLNQLFGDNPQMLAAAGIDPGAAIGAYLEGQKPQKLGQGDTLVQNGQATFTAPTYGQTDGRGFSLGPQGMQSLGELAPSQVQVWNRENQQGQLGLERDKFGYQQSHDARVNDPIAFGQLNVGRQQANAATMGAGASQQNAATNRMEYDARKAQGGFGTPGAAVAPWQMPWGQ